MSWRVGRKVGRTIYDGDTLIGVMDTPELAAIVVEAVNRRTASPSAPGVPVDELARVVGRASKNAPDFYDGEFEAHYLTRIGTFILEAIDRYKTKGNKWPQKPRATPGPAPTPLNEAEKSRG